MPDIDVVARNTFLDFNTRLNGVISQGLAQSLQAGFYIFDTFDRPNQLIANSQSTSGTTWSTTGTAANLIAIVNGNVVNPYPQGVAYCYQSNNGNLVTHIEAQFNFTSSGSTDLTYKPLTLACDNAFGGLTSLIHLNFGPTLWSLDIGNPTSFTNLGSGNINLQTDGTVYGISMDINYSTGTIIATLPDGTMQTFTNAGIGTTEVSTWGFIEILPSSSGFVGAFNGFSMGGPNLGPTLRGALQAAPMEEITWLRGVSANQLSGNFHQRVGGFQGVTLGSTAGYFTIATASVFAGTFAIEGWLVISANEPNSSSFSIVQVNATSSSTPLLTQIFHTAVSANTIDIVRLSNSTGVGVQLDIHQSQNRSTMVAVDFYGFFSPVPTPVIGATVLGTSNKSLTLVPGANIIVPPSADPHVVGGLWNNGGTAAFSAG